VRHRLERFFNMSDVSRTGELGNSESSLHWEIGLALWFIHPPTDL
jgi:hypothetical protein